MQEIDDNVILNYDRQIPRYTSYPTAVHFKSDLINNATYIAELKNLPKENLSLYFHIPFCKQLCWYCGCYTKATNRYAPIENYVYLLIREIKIISETIGFKATVSHIHFGGGSPTILNQTDFNNLINSVKGHFNITKNAEIAIEVDPRNLKEDDIKNYALQGINRVSIGVQDFNQEVQLAINRTQPFSVVYDCVQLFRKYKIDNINLDLIYGLPKQDVEMVKRNIDYSLLLQPERIAIFSYAHVQWIKKHMRLIKEEDLPSPKNKILMYKEAAKKLNEAGFISVGLDHFAKKENSMIIAKEQKQLKRNFQGYSSDNSNIIIGFGASAISSLPNYYIQNTLDFNEYKTKIIANELPIKKSITISQDDKIRKNIIDEIMCYMVVNLDKICTLYNLNIDYFADELEALKELESNHMIKIQKHKIIINQSYPQISRITASLFDKYLSKNNNRHSKIA